MRRSLFGSLVVLGWLGFAGEASAQFNANDPIFTYYGLYLPRQQAQALQPGPEASIANITANRQQYAATNRNDMFDFSGSTSFDAESGEFTSNTARRPGGPQRTASIGGNLNGFGPSRYYGTKVKPYHPTLRAGIHKNYNVAPIKPGRGGAGGGTGAAYAGVGLPGPR